MNESALRVARKAPMEARCKVYRKVRFSIWVCSGILFCTGVLFVLVAMDLSRVAEDPRLLVTFPYTIRSHALLEESDRRARLGHEVVDDADEALEGMGVLFRKGTRAMPELVVAHLSETTTADDLRLFLRGLHRSGMPARADVVLLYPWRPLAKELATVIRDEEGSFQKLLTSSRKSTLGKLSVFNPNAYTRTMPVSDYGKWQESMWGKGMGRNDSDEQVHYGAVVGFDVQELDPDDVLSGFLDNPPASLRRWVCYQMLIGMVRHRYRHVLLTEVSGVFVLKDVLAPLRKKDCSLHLYYSGQRWSDAVEGVYGKRFWDALEDEDKARKVVSAGVVVGGVRQIRGVAVAMATEIVRVALLRQGSVAGGADSAILSVLVHRSSVLGKRVASHLQVHDSGASVVNLLPGPPRAAPFDDFFRRSDSRFSLLQGLQNKAVAQDRRKKILESLRIDICGSQNDAQIYPDCYSQPLAGHTDATTTGSL